MALSRPPRHQGRPREAGSALVEFVFLAVLVMVPLFYLVITLARVQAGAYAVSTAAREAGRAFVTAAHPDEAQGRGDAAARLAFEDQGFEPDEAQVTMACLEPPCLRPGTRVEVTATVTVPLPLVPSFARAVVPLSVPLTASHVVVVDRFRSQP